MQNGNFLTRINYMRSAKYWIIFSIVLSVVGLAALFAVKLNTGIDFTGGNMLDVQFEQKVEQGQLDTVIEGVVGKNYQTQRAELKGGAIGDEYFVRTPELTEAKRADLLKGFEGLSKYKLVGEENVSGAVSKELAQKAFLALAIASLLQLIYIGFRFDLVFGVTAVVALIHDTVVTLGLLAILRVQVNSSFVAAILTLLGYSMNDTVVVIDRIRENMARRRKGESLADMTTRSIQEVITRSLITGVSVQAMLIAMLVWGGDSLWDMSMTLFIGTICGTYSSIFIAAALWLYWQEWRESKKPAKKGTAGKPVRA